MIQFTEFEFLDLFTSLLAFVPTGWSFLLIAQVFRPVLKNNWIRGTVVSVARLYNIMFGVITMTPVAFLSWMPAFQSMQTRILFNDTFSRGLQILKILSGKKSQVEKQF
ncbi:hypothetical protein M8C21_025224 [Ambrosia artemisiifolia]|uniref:Uncharacterized protein n=1 Tax=Ambrosia artemisiifolia TaxID=4212 RepID=A0AAD5C033_AMBAR|nr:hypothetical protein M8C21_025224 [Ambrosia artemisiifolia]